MNRESFVPVQSAELEPTAAPSSVQPVTTQQVESFDQAKTPSPIKQHGIHTGTLCASSVTSLDAKVAVAQVKELMSGFVVTDDDCRHAIGLLQSLPPAQYGKALTSLSESGALETLCEETPPELRRELAESAVQGGATRMQGERFPAGIRDPQPPVQPAMIVNSPSLPRALREVIHQENKARAGQYEEAFAAYADAYCAKVATCKTPLELRKLGPISDAPALLEPGISPADFAAKRFTSLGTRRGIGVERAAKSVSDQISVFRHELAAGSFGLDFKFKAQVKAEGEGPGHSDVGLGTAVEVKGSLTQDGRVINAGLEPEAFIEAGVGPAKLEAKINHHGHLDAVAAEVLIAGAELDRNGKLTFKVKVAPGVGVETFADPNQATMGAGLSVSHELEFMEATRELEFKAGFTAKGIAREYYQDIGGKQDGIFGPMPELDAGVKWSELKRERREWYARQGFDASNWR